MADETKEIRKQLVAALKGGQAHAGFEAAVKGLPKAARGETPHGLPYSPWQLVEHLRITQRDILDYSTNEDGHYQELEWPKQYWPEEKQPPSESAWDESLDEIRKDLKTFLHLVSDEKRSLTEPFSWDKEKNLLREALLIVDHTAYHLGELVVVRRLQGNWKS